MSKHAAIRHTETGGVGTAPAEAMDHHRARGWVRVSEYYSDPSDIDLSTLGEAPDLDAPADPEPKSVAVKAAKTSKEN